MTLEIAERSQGGWSGVALWGLGGALAPPALMTLRTLVQREVSPQLLPLVEWPLNLATSIVWPLFGAASGLNTPHESWPWENANTPLYICVNALIVGLFGLALRQRRTGGRLRWLPAVPLVPVVCFALAHVGGVLMGLPFIVWDTLVSG